MSILPTSLAGPRRSIIGLKSFRSLIALLICAFRTARSQLSAYICTWAGNLDVDSNRDSVPRRQSRGVILESHWGIQPWNLLKYPEKIGAIESKINLHVVPSCVSDTRWSHRSSNLTLILHGGSSLKMRPGLRIFCRRGYFLCISISRSFSCWRRLHRTNV